MKGKDEYLSLLVKSALRAGYHPDWFSSSTLFVTGANSRNTEQQTEAMSSFQSLNGQSVA